MQLKYCVLCIKQLLTHLIYCRVTALLGYQPQELLGKSSFDFYHPEDKTHMKDTFEQGTSLLNCGIENQIKNKKYFTRHVKY
jgi:hypothetical protein